MSAKVSYVELHTQDVDRARAFYGELFGWQFKTVPYQTRYDQIDGPQPGGIMEEKRGSGYWLQYIDVDDVAASTQKAERLGAKLITPKTEVPGMGWFSVMTDPAGASFALWQKA